MSSLEAFEIEFSEQGPYLEGQEVKCTVILDCKEDLVIEKLVVEFCGTAEVRSRGKTKSNARLSRLADDSNAGSNNLSFHASIGKCRHREKYLNQTITVYRAGNPSPFLLPAGRQSYPFRIQLPYNLPSSIVGRYGSIRYFCVATLTRPWQRQQKTRKEFVVKSLVDLSAHPEALRSFKYDERLSYRLLGCLGRVLVRWRVDRRGYMPLETIHIRGRISNYSLLELRGTRAVLYQDIRYCDGSERNVWDRREVCKITKGPLPSGEKELWRESMLVPNLPPSGLNGCTLMELSYTLVLEVNGSPLLVSPECFTNIIIGSTVGSSSWAAHMERTLSAEDLDLTADAIDTNYFV